MSKDLLKEAIADAKAVREAALANAKMALEESMTPKLQSMIAAKLAEVEELEETEELEESDVEEGFGTSQFGFGDEDNSDTDQTLEEDFDLSEILAELGNEYEEYEELEEAKKKDKKKKDEEEVKEAKKKKDEEEEEEENEEENEETEETEENFPESVDDLKDLIKDLIQQEMGSSSPEDAMAPGTDEVGDTVDVDTMGGEEMTPDMGDMGDMDDMGGEEAPLETGEEEEEEKKEEDEEEVNLEELLAELDALEEKKGAAAPAKEKEKTKEKTTKKPSTRPDTTPAKMEEALRAINTLKAELNEVNLLNAKLIYVNRIFKAKNLTEAQKVEVLASFDKATTIREAKMLFESLSGTLTTTPKRSIKESLGFASKPMGVAPVKRTIVESDDVIARMQKLANIK